MMTMNRLYTMRQTLTEANDYYDMVSQSGGGLNMDRVGYTSYMKLDVFRDLLDRPDLTIVELETILRAARQQVFKPHVRVPKPVVANVANDPGRDWATLMAKIIMTQANEAG